MISPLGFIPGAIRNYARGLGVRGAMFASQHPVLGAGALLAGGTIGAIGVSKLVGGISPFGTSEGAFGRSVKGAIFGGAAGMAAQVGLASRFAGSAMASKLGMYGAAAGAFLGAAIGSNRGPNRIRGFY